MKKMLLSRLIKRVLDFEFVRVYLADIGVRHNVYLLRSLISGVLYSAFNMLAAIYYNSRWFAAVSVYYVLLATTRYILYLTAKSHEWGEKISLLLYQRCRTVGIVMLFLNIAMATMIVYTILTSRGQKHSAIIIYLLAIYSVSVFVFNMMSVYYNRKRRLPLSYVIARIIAFCASFMSLFNFINSLVYTLDISGRAAVLINGISGVVVIVCVLALCIAVIYKCNGKIVLFKRMQ